MKDYHANYYGCKRNRPNGGPDLENRGRTMKQKPTIQSDQEAKISDRNHDLHHWPIYYKQPYRIRQLKSINWLASSVNNN